MVLIMRYFFDKFCDFSFSQNLGEFFYLKIFLTLLFTSFMVGSISYYLL